jgi:hypothetical protein
MPREILATDYSRIDRLKPQWLACTATRRDQRSQVHHFEESKVRPPRYTFNNSK